MYIHSYLATMNCKSRLILLTSASIKPCSTVVYSLCVVKSLVTKLSVKTDTKPSFNSGRSSLSFLHSNVLSSKFTEDTKIFHLIIIQSNLSNIQIFKIQKYFIIENLL